MLYLGIMNNNIYIYSFVKDKANENNNKYFSKSYKTNIMTNICFLNNSFE